jgi:hypothetical protein
MIRNRGFGTCPGLLAFRGLQIHADTPSRRQPNRSSTWEREGAVRSPLGGSQNRWDAEQVGDIIFEVDHRPTANESHTAKAVMSVSMKTIM